MTSFKAGWMVPVPSTSGVMQDNFSLAQLSFYANQFQSLVRNYTDLALRNKGLKASLRGGFAAATPEA